MEEAAGTASVAPGRTVYVQNLFEKIKQDGPPAAAAAAARRRERSASSSPIH
jgi:hypothetical protein